MGSEVRITPDKMTTKPIRTPFKDEITATLEGRLVWNQEAAILDTAELICQLMEEAGISRSDLAKLMDLTKGRISQMLDGTRNMTLRTLSDIFTHLGHEFRASYKEREEKMSSHAVFRLTAEIRIPFTDSAAFSIPQSVEMQPQPGLSSNLLCLTSLMPPQTAGA